MLGSKETLLDAYPAVLVAQVAVWGAKSSHTEPNRTSQGTPDRLATRPADRAGPKIHKPGRAISILIVNITKPRNLENTYHSFQKQQRKEANS